jgi:hypothetical protein
MPALATDIMKNPSAPKVLFLNILFAKKSKTKNKTQRNIKIKNREVRKSTDKFLN